MNNRREVLKTFPYKGKRYNSGGYIIESRFSEIELSILERMGNIAPKEKPKEELKEESKPKKTSKTKKRQEKKNVDKDKV